MKESLTLVIYKDLYDKIKSHFYKANQQLPTEVELEKLYKVSKAPVRQALGKLQNDGLIMRKAGKGTFVSPHIQKEKISFLGGFGSYYAKHKKHLSYRLVELKEVVPKEAVRKNLCVGEDDSVILISRIRLVNKKPIFLLNHYVTSFSIELFSTSEPIENMRQFLQNKGVEMAHITEKIQAVTVDEYLSKHFKLPIGSPLLKIYRTTFNQSYQPVVYEEYYVLSDEWLYEVQFNANENKQTTNI